MSIFTKQKTMGLRCAAMGLAKLKWGILCLIMSLAGSFVAQAQAPAWQNAILLQNTGPTNFGNSIDATAADANGNVYIVGNFVGTISFGTSSLTATNTSGDTFVTKFNTANNTFTWAVRAGGTGATLPTTVVVSGTNVYVSGIFLGSSATFGTTTLRNAGGTSGTRDIFVTKLLDTGSSAQFVWAQQAGGSSDDIAQSLALNGSIIYLTGSFSGAASAFGSTVLASAGYTDVFIAKLIDAGTSSTFSWAQRIGGIYSDEAIAVVVNGTSLYLSGSFSVVVSFGSTTLTSQRGTDAFVTKLTDLGPSPTFNWTQQAGGSQNDEAAKIAVVGSSVYVTGYFASPTITFGNTILTNLGQEDGFVAKLVDAGSSSQFVWAQQVGGLQNDEVLAVAVHNNSVYVSGFFSYDYSNTTTTTATFGPTTLQSFGGSDVFVSKLVDMGNTSIFAWTQQAGGPSTDICMGLALSGTRVCVTGYSGSATISFGNIQLSNIAAPAGASFLASFTDATLSSRSATFLVGLRLYPNPAHSSVRVVLPATDAPTATLSVLDALGKLIRTIEIPTSTSSYPLDLSTIPPGLYALRVQAGASVATQRLVVE